MVLNSPGNPDGQSYNAKELQRLAEVAKAHDMLIISDEIYGLLHHQGMHESFARYYEKTVITTGLSKWCGAGGWRLGAALVPECLNELKASMLGVASETYSCAPVPIQLAAIEAYTPDRRIFEFLKKARMTLKFSGTILADGLREAGI